MSAEPEAINLSALDNWITGSYGQVLDDDEIQDCPNPGVHGCGQCTPCDIWADDAYEASIDTYYD